MKIVVFLHDLGGDGSSSIPGAAVGAGARFRAGRIASKQERPFRGAYEDMASGVGYWFGHGFYEDGY